MSKLTFAAGLLVVLALAAACSGADKKPAPGTSGLQASAPPPTSSSSASESATGPTLKVLATQPTADLFTFDTAGTETVSAGAVSVTFTNGTTVAHELRLIRLRDDFTTFKLAIGQNGAAAVATLGDVVYASPTVAAGKSSTETANLAAGTYALVCFLSAPDGKTYAEHGMLTRLEVSPAALPTGNGSSETSASSAAGASGSSASSGSTAPSSSSSSASSASSSSSSTAAN